MSLSSQHSRAFCAVLRNFRHPRPVSQIQTPQVWIRAITIKPTRETPSISFGAEADVVLSKYIKKTKSSSKPPKKKGPDNITPKPEQHVTEDDFEIADYVDRSSSSPRHAHSQDADEDIPFEKIPQKNQRKKTVTKDTVITSTPSKPRREMEEWQIQKQVLKEKFKEGWVPRKRLSPDAMEGIRGLHEQDPNKYSTEVLAQQFKVSPEAIRRILKSKWLSKAGAEKMDEKRERFAKRHDRIWDQQVELGLRPQRVKDAAVEDPDKFDQDIERKRILREI